MNSDVPEVLSLLAALKPSIQHGEGTFSPNEFTKALYGLQVNFKKLCINAFI